MIRAKQDVYIDSDGNAVVAGPTARQLLVRAGQEISEAKLAKHEGAAALAGAEPTKAGSKGDAGKDLEERDTKGKKKH
jgi:hypothetical protein